MREIRLDVPVSDALFELPNGLKTTKQFQVPRQPFELVLRETRSSSKWGWSILATTLFSSDGEVIKAARTDVHRDENGERITGPTETVRPFDEAVLQFNYLMGEISDAADASDALFLLRPLYLFLSTTDSAQKQKREGVEIKRPKRPWRPNLFPPLVQKVVRLETFGPCKITDR